jgi:hypothetical protein
MQNAEKVKLSSLCFEPWNYVQQITNKFKEKISGIMPVIFFIIDNSGKRIRGTAVIFFVELLVYNFVQFFWFYYVL